MIIKVKKLVFCENFMSTETFTQQFCENTNNRIRLQFIPQMLDFFLSFLFFSFFFFFFYFFLSFFLVFFYSFACFFFKLLRRMSDMTGRR